MSASFRNLFVQKRVELQRPYEMRRQPRSTRLPQVVDSHATDIDFDPARFSGSHIIIEFKPLLPPKRLKSFCFRGWRDRHQPPASHPADQLHQVCPATPPLAAAARWPCDAIPPAPSKLCVIHGISDRTRKLSCRNSSLF